MLQNAFAVGEPYTAGAYSAPTPLSGGKGLDGPSPLSASCNRISAVQALQL